jgi:integrase/recombinase XerD
MMNTLREAINDYVAMRRGLGFKLVQMECWLRDFATFMEAQGAACVTAELALQWAMKPVDAQPSCWAKRLTAVRCFARHRSATDPCTEIPAWGLLPHRSKRAKPYLYTEQEIGHLMQAARELPPSNGLRGWTYCCLFGLLAVTGLRISEALALQRHDVDLQQGLLTIRGAKFGKSRLVPLHPSTREALSQYAKRRDDYLEHQAAANFLVSERGRALKISAVHRIFYELSRRTGLRGTEDRTGPRLHDFRHRLAMETLLRWYRCGEDVEQRIPVLSTFLGHACVSATYWYLSACPELMGHAARRLEQRWEVSS